MRLIFDPVFVHRVALLSKNKSQMLVPIGIKNLAFTGPLQIELKDLCGKVSQPEMKTLMMQNKNTIHFEIII